MVYGVDSTKIYFLYVFIWKSWIILMDSRSPGSLGSQRENISEWWQKVHLLVSNWIFFHSESIRRHMILFQNYQNIGYASWLFFHHSRCLHQTLILLYTCVVTKTKFDAKMSYRKYISNLAVKYAKFIEGVVYEHELF